MYCSPCLCLTSAMRLHSPGSPVVLTSESSEGFDPKRGVYTWQYHGQDESAHGTQRAQPGSLLMDDCDIEIPDIGYEKVDRSFFLRTIEPGKIIGYYHHEHECYEHIRTPGHVQAVVVIENPSAPPHRFIEVELTQDKENQQRTRPRLSRKAKKKRNAVLPISREAFDKIARARYPMEILGLNSAGQKLIHMVRAYRQQEYRGPWTYQGRVIGSDVTEDLQTEWLNENGMHHVWRKLTVLLYPGAWYRVPISAVEARMPHTVSCTKTSVEKAFAYMGLTKQLAQLSKSNFVKNPFAQVKNQIRRMKGFKNRRLIAKTFNPVRDAKRNSLYFIQICSRHVLTRVLDQTHAICIFDNLIFDVNVADPLALSYTNLDRCCLGDACIFDSACQVEMFTPTKGVARFISNHLSSPIVLT